MEFSLALEDLRAAVSFAFLDSAEATGEIAEPWVAFICPD